MSFDPTKFSEHHIPRGEGRVYARDYAGAGPAFVLMHGFPRQSAHLGRFNPLSGRERSALRDVRFSGLWRLG